MSFLRRRGPPEPPRTVYRAEGDKQYKHDPPPTLAHVRVIRFNANVGRGLFEYLGGDRDSYPACILPVEPTGYNFGMGVRGYLASMGKDIELFKLTPTRTPRESRPPRFRRPPKKLVEGRKLIIVDDILIPEEYASLSRQINSWKDDLEFEDVVYATETDCLDVTPYAVYRRC